MDFSLRNVCFFDPSMGQRIDFSLVIGKPAEAVAVAWFLGGTLGWVSLECRITDCSRNLINKFAPVFLSCIHAIHFSCLKKHRVNGSNGF